MTGVDPVRTLGVLLLLAASGCGGDTGDSAQTLQYTGGGSTLACGELVNIFPAQGATGVPLTTTVGFEVTEIRPAELSVTDSAGNRVPGTQGVAGQGVEWVSDVLLKVGEEYTVTIDWCGPEEVVTWTTEAPPAIPVEQLTGRVWTFDLLAQHPLGDAGASLPLWVVADASTQFQGVLLQLTPVDPADATAACDAALPGAETNLAANPYFETAWTEGSVTVGGGTGLLGGGSALGLMREGDLDALDVRVWVDASLFDVGKDACDVVAEAGFSCEACPDGSGNSCVEVRHRGPWVEVPGASVDCPE